MWSNRFARVSSVKALFQASSAAFGTTPFTNLLGIGAGVLAAGCLVKFVATKDRQSQQGHLFQQRVATCRSKEAVDILIEKPVTTTTNSNTQNALVKAAGLGATLGFATGYFVKKIGRMMLIIVGCQFVFLQTLSFFRIIDIHWDRIAARDDDPNAVTVTVVARRGESRLLNLLTHNLPFKIPFIGGFYLGFRMG